ncbi:MAG: STN domain-containing protein, partial [Casimicrobiaceae bacterium]
MSKLNCHRIHRRATLCAAILAGFALHAQAAEPGAPLAKPAAASAKAVSTFAVKAGSTLDVLRALEQQSGVSIDIDTSSAERQTSPAITGTMSLQQAILRAIDGTGLTLGEQADGKFIVATLQTLDVVHVYAQRDKAETRFKADRSDTATRSGSDLSEV